jgi:hypothetical protein
VQTKQSRVRIVFFLLHALAAVGHSSSQLVFPPRSTVVGAVPVDHLACMSPTCADRLVSAGCVMAASLLGVVNVCVSGGMRGSVDPSVSSVSIACMVLCAGMFWGDRLIVVA